MTSIDIDPSERLAHLTPDGRRHLLADHLGDTATLAAEFGARFGAGEWARLAGFHHDLGKYAAVFQNMIRRENGFEARIEGPDGPRDHSTAGAVFLAKAGAVPAAIAVAGHHGGLADLSAFRERIATKVQRLDDAIAGRSSALEQIELPKPPFAGSGDEAKRRLEMWTRMLFSALCDADFLDTERFFNPERAGQRGSTTTIDELALKLSTYLEEKEKDARERAPTEVNRVRAEVRQACLAAAAREPGVFSLTVPTGGGKTLAGMSFALEHARRHAMDRVIVAIPFTSIIEQSADAYREGFGQELSDAAVLEHHSNFEPPMSDPPTPEEELRAERSRVLSENWDAPVVVTTTVQLFDSLFANRPGACRKLHRIAKSVVILDEAQTLPLGLLEPLLDGLRSLVRDFGVTLVLSTATQPAFHSSSLPRTRMGEPIGFADIEEIVPPEIHAFDRLRRVRARWPSRDSEPTTFDQLADEIASERDVLAVVHRRKDARELCEALDARLGDTTTLHLSALMCADHRSAVLKEIKDRKKRGEPVRVVSTQLVEAGVDLDFPVVYRALSGLDSLAQAAGRCNREGNLDGLGELRIFLAPTDPPRGVPQAAMQVTRGFLEAGRDIDLFAPEIFREYFERLYNARDLDAKGIQETRAKLHFKETAERFHLIEDDWSAPLVVPWGDGPARVARLEREGPSRETMRALQRFIIAVPRREHDEWLRSGKVRLAADTISVVDALFAKAYDARFGLVTEQLGVADPAALMG